MIGTQVTNENKQKRHAWMGNVHEQGFHVVSNSKIPIFGTHIM